MKIQNTVLLSKCARCCGFYFSKFGFVNIVVDYGSDLCDSIGKISEHFECFRLILFQRLFYFCCVFCLLLLFDNSIEQYETILLHHASIPTEMNQKCDSQQKYDKFFTGSCAPMYVWVSFVSYTTTTRARHSILYKRNTSDFHYIAYKTLAWA